MAKKPTEEEIRQQNMAEAVSKTELFFQKNGKIIYGCVLAVLIIAIAILAYNRFILQPKKVQAQDQMVKAEQWFEAGDYQMALEGDGNDLGFEDIIQQYGAKGGQSVYLYAGISKLQLGAFDEAIDYLKKYKGSDPIMLSRAQCCIGDAYVGKEDYATAITWFEKAAGTADNLFAAGYLVKAGLAAEAMGNTDKALALYKEVKDKYANAPEAAEIDKYITRIETK